MDTGVWLELNADRELTSMRAQADSAKLLATFAVSIAAAAVLAAVGDTGGLLRTLAIGTFLGGFGCAVLTVVLDRQRDVDHATVLEQSAALGWDSRREVRELRFQLLKSVAGNRLLVVWIRRAAMLALLLSLAAVSLAIVALVTSDVAP